MSAFHATPIEGREYITLKKANGAIAFDDWSTQAPTSGISGVARLMQAWADNAMDEQGAPLVEPHQDGVLLHPAFVAALSDHEAASIGLPPTTRLSLAVQTYGLVHRDDFTILTRWSRPTGLPAAVQVQGARLRVDNRDWRIPDPLWSVLNAAERLRSSQEEPARYAALAKLRQALGDEFQERIRADGYLEQLRLSYAAGFSLDLRTEGGTFDFDPVLFGNDALRAAEESPLDQQEDMLLTPMQQTNFAKRFRQSDVRRAYLLDDGTLLFIDPTLKKALTVVHQAQRGDAKAREQFASNPRRFLADSFDAPNESTSASDLFVETQQFSERVSGIDIWRKPVLPWVKPKPNSWLPESFGLRIGEPPQTELVDIKPEQLYPLIQATQLALEEGKPSIEWEGKTIPVTQQTHKALADLAVLADAAKEHKGEPKPPPAIAEKYFLQIHDNLEQVGYAPLGTARNTTALVPEAFPQGMRFSPKPHQVLGFQWLASCWHAQIPGALLADDMGLGKTFQAISFMLWLRQQKQCTHPVLIVAPTGLLKNWRNEIEVFVGDRLGTIINAFGKDLKANRITQGRDIDAGASALNTQAWQGAGVVLTTFETMRDYHFSFARQPFAAIIYDEAQKLKNPASQMTRAAKTLHARFQLAMTGTPVENRLQDLWSIYDVVFPGMLGSSKAFENKYPASDMQRLRELHDFLVLPQQDRPPLLLRRMKDNALEGLPKKHIVTLPLPMPVVQASAYERVIQRAIAARDSGKRGYMLEILHLLRGVSLHPRAPRDADRDPGYFAQSARLQGLFATLDAIRTKQEKVLIFCERLEMQALLAVEIQRRYSLDHAVPRIHGGVAGDARQTLVDQFQQREPGFDVMILSPKAGGVGLTLTAANHVIHLSRWWNPAVEDQATDRAYRIGQKKDVTVYLPQSEHPDPSLKAASFDHTLHALMNRKRALSQGLLVPGDDESDTKILFDAVMGDAAEPEAEVQSEIEMPPAPQAAAEEVPTSQISYKRRVENRPNKPRDHSIFLAPLAGEQVVDLEIRDPYACAGIQNRGCVIDFVQLLVDTIPIAHVTVVCLDADSTGNDISNKHLMDDFRTRWAKYGLPAHRLTLLSKRQHRSFHDRRIAARTQSGRRLIWDLGHGVDGLMRESHECTVVLTEE